MAMDNMVSEEEPTSLSTKPCNIL